MIAPKHIGEVVEATTNQLVAQALKLHQPPAFGSFVKTESDYVVTFGVVYEAQTTSLEPNRRSTAYGLSEEELQREQPQIFSLLRTEFKVLTIGFKDSDAWYGYLPPQPPRIHAFVEECTEEEVVGITSNFNYLHTLCFSQAGSDELIAACLRRASQAHPVPRQYLIDAGKELVRLLKDDYDRFNAILRRLR
ncbi:MAG: hypothetical protein HPY81_03150 [Firmicutes bacterium]|nr:hypothetical protein [Bacillota bacterium]